MSTQADPATAATGLWSGSSANLRKFVTVALLFGLTVIVGLTLLRAADPSPVQVARETANACDGHARNQFALAKAAQAENAELHEELRPASQHLSLLR